MTADPTTLAVGLPAATLAEHVRRTLALALPVMVARAGIVVLAAVDTAMTGYAGAAELAYYGLGFPPQIPMIMVGIGLLMGTGILSAQAVGAGDLRHCGQVWRVALAHAVVLGLLCLALSQLGHAFYLAIGQDPGLAEGGARVLVMFGWSMPAIFLYVATSFFLEGIGRPLPGMLIMLAANVANAALNWAFIYGNAGAPAMGAEGAALATTAVRWISALAIIGYALQALDHRSFGLRGRIAGPWSIGRRLRRLGYALALSHGMESTAFTTLAMFAGWLGTTQLGGFQVSMNLVALVFMCAIGFATAGSVRVGNAVGRGDGPGVARAGWVAVGLAGLVMLAFTALFAGAPGLLARIYTNDATVLLIAAPTIAVTALVLFSDGAQGVLMGCLRGAGDVWVPAVIYLIAFPCVQIPVGYLLGVARGGGAPGLMLGALAGLTTAAVLLGLRFHIVSRRPVARS